MVSDERAGEPEKQKGKDDQKHEDNRWQPSPKPVDHHTARIATSPAAHHVGGRKPASVTATSRRTAALDGRLPAAARAWRQ